MSTRSIAKRPDSTDAPFNGVAQLSLVEHSLSPLRYDTRGDGFLHRVSYPIYSRGKRPVTAHVTVSCPLGLTPADELILWGLLSLTLSDDKPSTTFYATRNFVLEQLGLPTGGSYYEVFDAACRRMEFTTYENTAFYDPVRGELCDTRFGFFKRRKPTGEGTERGDRFIWDQQFFEFAQHAYGRMKFPFRQYQQYSPGARRLFLLLRKFFHRRAMTPEFDLSDLAVNKLGLHSGTRIADLKKLVTDYAQELLDDGVLELPPEATHFRDCYVKRTAGEYRIRFHRGPKALRADDGREDQRGSALTILLRDLDISPTGIRWILDHAKGDAIREWIDITLAAKERGIIKTTPAAFFMDNLKQAVAGSRQPPDWWRDIRKQEDEKEWQEAGQILRSHVQTHCDSQATPPTFEEYMHTDAAQDAFEQVCQQLFDICSTTSMSEDDQQAFVNRQGMHRMRSLYYTQYSRPASNGPQSLFDILRDQ